MFFMCPAATDHQHGWGATGSDQTQSRWEDLRQDEERPGAPRSAACMLHTPSIPVSTSKKTLKCLEVCVWLCGGFLCFRVTCWKFRAVGMKIFYKNGKFNHHVFIFLVVCVSQAYDQHLNMILGDVEETVTTVEIDEETYEELYKVKRGFLPFTTSFLITGELLLWWSWLLNNIWTYWALLK